MNRIILYISIFAALSDTVQCQNADRDTASTKLSGIFCSDSRDFIDCIALRFHEVTHPDGSSLITAGVVAGTTAALFFADQSVRSFAGRSRSTFNDDVLNITEQYGATADAIIISGSIYSAGLLFGTPEIRKTGTMLLESLFWTGVVTSVIKYTFGRARPYMNEGNVRFHGVQFSDNYLSFPSGHVAVAFTLSSVLSERINNTAASIGLYTLAGLTGAARIYHDQHWLSDVFLGAFIGTSVGTAVAHDDDEKSSSHCSTRIFLTPNGFGFAMEF
ncbi:MAG: phosphatase PAP2 family protein [Bacteroidota bacterium]